MGLCVLCATCLQSTLFVATHTHIEAELSTHEIEFGLNGLYAAFTHRK